MSLHGQKDHVIGPTALVHGDFVERFAEQFNIFLVTGDDEGVVNFLAVSVIIEVLNHFASLHALSSVENPSRFEVGGYRDDKEEGRLDGEVEAEVETNLLIEFWNEEGSQEHKGPAGQVEKGDYELVFVVVGEIRDLHAQLDVENYLS